MSHVKKNLKSKLDNGQLTVGSAIYSWSPNIMEAAGYAGLDFMRIARSAWAKGVKAIEKLATHKAE